MKITRSRLRQIIKEEVSKTLVTKPTRLIGNAHPDVRIKGADGVLMTLSDYHRANLKGDPPKSGTALMHGFTLVIPDGASATVHKDGKNISLEPGEYTTNNLP